MDRDELPKGFEVTLTAKDVPDALQGAKLEAVFDWDLMFLGVSIKKGGSGTLSQSDVDWVVQIIVKTLKAGGIEWNPDRICIENYHKVKWFSVKTLVEYLKWFRLVRSS